MPLNQQRLFCMSPERYANREAELKVDNDDIFVDLLYDSRVIYPNGYTVSGHDFIIVRSIIHKEQIEDIEDFTDCTFGTRESVTAMDIVTQYCGEELSDEPGKGLFWFFPQLAGQFQDGTDEETGEPIMKNIVLRLEWP